MQSPFGKLVFEKFASGKTVHKFEYAKHIVALDVLQTPPYAGMVQAWGEGPSGGHGLSTGVQRRGPSVYSPLCVVGLPHHTAEGS